MLADLDGGHRQDRSTSRRRWSTGRLRPDGGTVAVALDGSREPIESASGPGTGRGPLPRSGDRGGRGAPPIDISTSAIGVGYARSGDLVAVITDNNVSHFFSPADGREVRRPDRERRLAHHVDRFSPDGASRGGPRRGVGCAPAVRPGHPRPVGGPLDGDANGVYGVAYSPDGTLLAGTTLGFSTTRLWDADSGVAARRPD